jgi:hypothetical protein
MSKTNKYDEITSFVLPSFKRDFDKRKVKYNDKLNFTKEAIKYFRKKSTFISGIHHMDVVVNLAEKLAPTYAGQSIVSIMPCFAFENTENIDIDALSNYINSMSKNYGHVVIFIHGESNRNKHNPQDIMDFLYDNLDKTCKEESFSIINFWMFDGTHPMGLIRSVITDAVIYLALDLQVEDLIIVSNDIDLCYTPENYSKTIGEYFAYDAYLDILTGPLFYGYAYTGHDYLRLPVGIPNLFVENCVIHARCLSKLLGDFYRNSFFETPGTHTAFRASAYCAANGYDVALKHNEDEELGLAIFALRQEGELPFPSTRNAMYAPDFCLATNPRRQLLAIANGHSIIETWKGKFFIFNDKAYHKISLQAVADQCYRAKNQIIFQDFDDFLEKGAPQPACWERMIEMFLKGIADRSLPGDALTRYLNYCGVEASVEDVTNLPVADRVRQLAKQSKPSYRLRQAVAYFNRLHTA